MKFHRGLWGASALALAALGGGAQAADVTISSSTSSGVNLDSYTGSTAEVLAGVTVTNAAFANAVKASAAAWALTNEGTISSSLANTITLSVAGSSVINYGSVTGGASSNAIALAGGGAVDNKAGASISAAQSGVIIGSFSAGAGSFTNAGTVTQTGSTGDLVELLFGGTVTNLQGGTISAANGSNAVSVGQGASRAVMNAGTISNTGGSFATGVLLQGGASTLTNTATGHISGTFNGVYASASTPLTFTNAGLIESTGANPSARAVEATGGGTFVNSGTIRSAASDGLYLARAGTVTNSGTITGAVNAINFSGNYARTLKLDTGSVLNGLVQGGTGVDDLVLLGTGTQDISKILAFETLALQGTAWTLTGAGAFATGGTVASGTLTISGTLTSPALAVNSGGTLTGGGTVAAATSIADGGTLAGQTGRTLTVSSLTLSPGAAVAAALGAPGGAGLFHVLGNLTLDGTLNVSSAGGFGDGVYRLFDYGGALTDQGLAIGATVPGTMAADYTVQTAVANQVNLLVQIGPADTQFWNGSATTATGQIQGGDGVWTAGASTNWTDSAGIQAEAWKGHFAVFQASRGGGLPASGTVTVDDGAGPVTATGLQFIGSGWTVTGDTITLAGAGGATTIRVGDGSAAGAADQAIIAAQLTGSTQLVKDDLGTLILTGDNSYGGGTAVNAGTLQVGNGGTGGSITGDVAIAGAFAIDRSDDVTFNGALSGAGSFAKLGNGRLTLTGASAAFTGTSTVQAGTLAVNGSLGGTLQVLSGARLEGSGAVAATSIADGGTLAGQTGRTLTLNSLALSSGAAVAAALGAPGGAGLFHVLGNLTLDGTLNVSNAGGFGDGVYRLFDYDGTLIDQGLAIGATPSGTSAQDFTVQTAVSHQVNLLVQIGPGDTQFWNGSTTTATGQVQGGSGRWTAGPATNWTDANGARADAWQGHFAVFEASRNGGAPASGTVTVDDSAGAVSATGLQFIGSGWTVTGDAIALAGAGGATTIRVGDGSAAGAADQAIIAAQLTGSTQLVKDDLGTLVLTGNDSYGGGTLVKAGTLRIGNGGTGGSITGDVAVAGALILDRADDVTFGGALSGAGSFDKLGNGRLTLTGNSAAFTGTTTIHGGTLSLDGALGGTLILPSGTRLQGTGTAGAVSLASGATVAPGHSIGTLSAASISFAPGSVYEVEANAAGAADRITASGTAAINGGTVTVLAADGSYARATQYTILSAAGGISGPGFSGVTSNLAFLTPTLQQTANAVILTLSRNTIDFGAIGGTFNQRAAGGGVESLGSGPVYDAVLYLDIPGARAAFDQVSGEIHASLRTALFEDSRIPRDTVLDRLAHPRGTGIWGQAIGDWGHTGGDGNAATLDRDTAGFLVGGDAAVGEAWRLGLAAGYLRQDMTVSARASRAGADRFELLGYGGADYGPIRIALGVGYAAVTAHTRRDAAFPGFSDMLKAGYDGSVLQGFGEVSYPLALESGTLEPYGQIAAVRVSLGHFAESGGAAALRGAGGDDGRVLSTLGLRGTLPLTDGLSLEGGLGWRHAFGTRTFLSRLSFAGSADFAVAGVPYARDAAAVDAGLNVRAAESVSAWLHYNGMLGGRAADNGVRAGLSIRF